MEITLRNYQPFSWTKKVDNYAARAWKRPANNFLEISQKIALVALGILTTGIVLVADFVMTGVSLAYRAYYRSPEPTHRAEEEEENMPKGKVPDRATVLKILATPTGFSRPAISPQFLNDALKSAFYFLDIPTKARYKELIADGISDEETTAPDMYKWCAANYIAHYLRSSIRELSRLYPFVHPELEAEGGGRAGEDRKDKIRKLEKDFVYLSGSFLNLREIDRATVLLKIISPETDWGLPKATKKLVIQINAVANRMILDPHYLKEIYTPAIKDIANF